ncbi:transposase [Orbaceae bacterium ESL0727]|nr:transposase [Orbaceae bacterium ESL0727]MDF7666995.1 transposase [Orbaceae bacterium ESL0727]MDF7667050.1 transposase [Orbaceae bacterium ESL0727]MDF7667826.1 transposase [Orbaceae bacterium ESL0727]
MCKKYDPQFKQEAINLALNSKQSYRQTASDLGINYKTFCNWMYQTMNKPTHHAIKSNKKPDYQELERQNKAMKRELELRKKEIDILKKAAQYFASLK